MVRRATNAEAGAVARPSAFALFMQDMKIQGLSPRRISHDGRCRLTKKTPLKGMENYRLRWNLTLPNPVSLYMLLHLPIMHCPVLLTYSTSNDTSSFGIADLSFVIVAL